MVKTVGKRGRSIFRRAGLSWVLISLVFVASGAMAAALLSSRQAGPSAAAPAPGERSPQPTTSQLPTSQPPSPASTIARTLETGVLIVISKASQRMQVFRDGEPWLVAPVSTGRSGHRTPAGVFPILEKRRFHRSNLYSNAPMPFMQRLTHGGIAIHAGRLPGYPASHGCVRVPMDVARTLFAVTSPRDTTVVIVNQPMPSAAAARRLALAWQPRQPALLPLVQRPPRRAATEPAPPPVVLPPAPLAAPGPGQTIQLAAALSPQEAEAHWSRLLDRHAELGRFSKAVVPAVIGARRYYRLRVSGPGAFASCAQLRTAGTDCFKVL